MEKLVMPLAVVMLVIGAAASVQAAGTRLIPATGGIAGTCYPFGGPWPRSGTPRSRT